MSGFFKSKFFIVLIIITVLILAFMIISTASRDKASALGNAAGVVVTPIQKFFWGISDGVSDFFRKFGEIDEYKTKYEQAEQRLTETEDELREIQGLRAENERLRGLLSMKEKQTEFKTIGARVTAKNPGNWYNDFIIDRGTADGVVKNCTVMTDKGLVGHVAEVGTTWSRVVTVIDQSSSISCIVPRSDDRAITEGDLDLMENGVCRMSYISKDASVVVGDYVETSGLGGVYPPGLLIGKIKEITPDLQGLYHQAVLEPAVDFGRLSELLVIIERQ